MRTRAARLRRAAHALCAAAVLLLAGCGDSATLSPLAPGAVVLAFGDSLTYGTGAGQGESYPEVLAGLIGRTVVRAGVPGETTPAGLRRLPGVLAESRPALVILCHGGNDILRKLSKTEAADNLRKMIALIRESGAEVVLLGVPRFGLFPDVAPFYVEVAESEAVPMQGDIIPDVLTDNGLKSDSVHPNAAGYARVAEAVAALLRDQGAL